MIGIYKKSVPDSSKKKRRRKFMKKVSLIVLSVFAVVALFVFASASQTQAAGVTIDYTALWSEGEPQSHWLRQVAAEYEAVTGNKINFTFAGRDVLTMIRNRILAGDPPDIVDHDCSELMAALVTNEILAKPLNDLLASPGLDGETRLSDAFSAEILGLYNKDGGTYFLPYIYITSGFFYDKTLFAKAGITPPKTWDEFITAGEKFMAETGLPFLALDGVSNGYTAYYYYWACQRMLGAGKLFSAATDATGAAWDDPRFLTASEMLYEISKGGKNFFQDGYEGSAFPAGQSDWALGNQGCVLNGTWLPVEVRDFVADDLEFGFFPFPTVDGGVGTIEDMEGYLIGWSILKGAKNAKAAEDFLKFAVNKKNAASLVEITHNMSSRLDTAPPEVLSDAHPYVRGARAFHLSYDGLRANAAEWCVNVFYNLNKSLIYGHITPEEFISQIKEATINFYDK
jgi:raffinose/stachyose/melibiose transport system substrate-binding protein